MSFLGSLGSLFEGIPIIGPLLGQSQANKDIKRSTHDLDVASQTAYKRGAMSPEELSQYQGSFDIGSLLEQIYKAYMGQGTMPEGQLSPEAQYQNQTGQIGSALYQNALQGAQNPYAGWESSLQPQLAAMSDYVNSQMQSRGLLNSGLDIEQMGRAGVDLAVQEAQNRMAYGQQSLQNASTMAGNVQNTVQANLANLSQLYNQQQGYGVTGAARQAGQALGVLPTQTAPYYAGLGQAYGNLNANQQKLQQQGAALASFATGGMQGGMPALGSSLFAA